MLSAVRISTVHRDVSSSTRVQMHNCVHLWLTQMHHCCVLLYMLHAGTTAEHQDCNVHVCGYVLLNFIFLRIPSVYTRDKVLTFPCTRGFYALFAKILCVRLPYIKQHTVFFQIMHMQIKCDFCHWCKTRDLLVTCAPLRPVYCRFQSTDLLGGLAMLVEQTVNLEMQCSVLVPAFEVLFLEPEVRSFHVGDWLNFSEGSRRLFSAISVVRSFALCTQGYCCCCMACLFVYLLYTQG